MREGLFLRRKHRGFDVRRRPKRRKRLIPRLNFFNGVCSRRNAGALRGLGRSAEGIAQCASLGNNIGFEVQKHR
ncbi:hypothetical protein F2P81_005808 [Scophthalmus maximus]|uniref:Uncharacterized protein n=1 Tax=Scophthalmus maximus TaxID=52904 RepID=A0A6A4T443_SCOMX|nr:hypothetical protein F2P81_005808 [Scophthalmus maximus]